MRRETALAMTSWVRSGHVVISSSAFEIISSYSGNAYNMQSLAQSTLVIVGAKRVFAWSCASFTTESDRAYHFGRDGGYIFSMLGLST